MVGRALARAGESASRGAGSAAVYAFSVGLLLIVGAGCSSSPALSSVGSTAATSATTTALVNQPAATPPPASRAGVLPTPTQLPLPTNLPAPTPNTTARGTAQSVSIPTPSTALPSSSSNTPD